MTEFIIILLSVLLIASFIFIYRREEQNRLERRELHKFIKAKDLEEVVLAEKFEKQEKEEEAPPDIIPTEHLSDEDFLNAIRN